MNRNRSVLTLASLGVLALIGLFAWWLTGEPGAPTDRGSDRTPIPGSSALRPVGVSAQPPLTRARADSVDEGSGSRSARIDLLALDSGAGDAADPGTMASNRTRDDLKAMLEGNTRAAEKHVDRFCAETKDLMGRKDLSQPPRTKDAALYMSSRTDWEGGRIGSLHLPASITDRMGNPPGAWRQAGPELYAGLDFTWMQELHQFDHWTLSTVGPLRDDDRSGYLDAPLPNFVTLQTWTKLRLLKGLHEKDLAGASLEVRHLADLIGSSGTLISDMIRVAIYGIERKTWEDAGLEPVVPVMSANDAWRARHAAFAGMYFLYPGVSKQVREKALKCMPFRCSALIEGIGVAAALRDVIPGMDEQIAWLREQQPCDPGLAERAARATPANDAALQQLELDVGVEKSLRAMTDGGI